MRSLVTFRSDSFNKSVSKPGFINAGNYGDDLASWVIDRLKANGIEAEETPIQEDYGWVVTMDIDKTAHWIVLGYRPAVDGEGDDWVAWVEKKRSFFGVLRGKGGKVPDSAAVEALHRILRDAPEVADVRWHLEAEFERGLEDSWKGEP